MVILTRLKTVVTGATSVILIQLLSSISAPLEHTFIHPSINLSFSSPVLADTPPKARPKPRYVPPNRRPPKSTKASGSRGCVQSSPSQPVTLTLLAPNDHDGLTISSHPTFFWHVSAPVPMAFALIEPGVVQPLLEKQIQPQETGIIQLKMPQDLPELVPGREYRWSVTLICYPARPSANPIIERWINRVPTTPALTQQISAATSENERALIYAQAGLWYNALEAISTAHNANPNNKSILEDRLLLLDQVGLTQVAALERQHLGRASVQ